MTKPWRDVVATIAGPDAAMSVTDGAIWDAVVIAEVDVPGGLFRSPGNTEDDAWRGIAHRLGDFRVVQLLEAAGWTEIDEVIDQVTYVVARDPDRTLWAIGVASADSDRRGYIESDIKYDHRPIGKVAFIEPVDTRNSDTLFAALYASA